MTDPAAPSAPRAPAEASIRYEARVLDPATAIRLGGVPPSVTAYRGDTLLVTAPTREYAQAVINILGELAADLGLQPAGPDVFDRIDDDEKRTPRREIAAHNRFARLLGLAEEAGVPLVVPVKFEPGAAGPAPAVDVWPLLQAFRDQTFRDTALRDTALRDTAGEKAATAVGLDHLMFAAAIIAGNPFSRGLATIGGSPFSRGLADIGGSPFSRGLASGVDQYLAGGSGGHGPVSVVLAAPRPDPDACHPHVVVLDTGVGDHPWFDVTPVDRDLRLANNDPVGVDLADPEVIDTDPEAKGAVPDPLTGLLATHAGHGTFITGLLAQACPNAHISALRIMAADGVVAEDELTQSLMALGVRLFQDPGSIDALVLSLGYYAESDDAAYTAGVKDLLIDLASRGVVTFVAAGNDCTDRRSYPAAFADQSAFNADGSLPLMAVAALNPDESVALFSNDATWVNGEAPGANVVSTAPLRASGAWAADTMLVGPNGELRGTIDPDDFRGGFATWSGTSFAAPVLAGRYLSALVRRGCPDGFDDRRRLVPARRPGTSAPVAAEVGT